MAASLGETTPSEANDVEENASTSESKTSEVLLDYSSKLPSLSDGLLEVLDAAINEARHLALKHVAPKDVEALGSPLRESSCHDV